MNAKQNSNSTVNIKKLVGIAAIIGGLSAPIGYVWGSYASQNDKINKNSSDIVKIEERTTNYSDRYNRIEDKIDNIQNEVSTVKTNVAKIMFMLEGLTGVKRVASRDNKINKNKTTE